MCVYTCVHIYVCVRVCVCVYMCMCVHVEEGDEYVHHCQLHKRNSVKGTYVNTINRH